MRSLIPEGSGAALDIGCGTGPVSRILWSQGYAVVGIDNDAAAIEAARRASPDCTFVVQDILSTPLPAGPFAIVAACEVLEHFTLADQLRLLRAVRARLAPTGHLVLSTPNRWSLMAALGAVVYPLQGRRWDYGDPTHMDVHDPRSLGHALRSVGLRIARVRGFQLLTHRPAAIAGVSMRAYDGLLARVCYDLVVDAVPA